MLAAYRTDPDPGIHGAIDWLLRRRWNLGEELDAVNKELASPTLPTDRDWYVNGQGQTFSIIHGPIEFLMGSTVESAGEADRQPLENQHRRRIPRSYVIGTREVTVAEYVRFLEANADQVQRFNESNGRPITDWRGNEQFEQHIRTTDCAIGAVTLDEAMRYCNWLSKVEGIPKDQWAYPDEPGDGMKLADDFLARGGYRLPTEGEWELACRSGTISARPYGRSEKRLEDYAWYLENSGQKMHPVGSLKPNDLGLFDALGNALEWCGDAYQSRYPAGEAGSPLIDALVDADYGEASARVVRGGSWNNDGRYSRSANRGRYTPENRFNNLGFRVAAVRSGQGGAQVDEHKIK